MTTHGHQVQRPRLAAHTVKALADTKQHLITATAYDRTCARRADELATRDTWVMNVVLVLTTVSSLGVFGALVEDNPATWARVTVFVMTTAAAVLTAGERRRVDEGNSRLLRDHPPIPKRMYDAAVRRATEDSERIQEFR